MGTISFIGKQVCEKAFPDSSAFAQYLSDRLQSQQASLELTRIFCDSLQECYRSQPLSVSPECVERLSVENDGAAISRMMRAHPNTPTTVIGDVLTFLTRVSGHVKVPRRAKSLKNLKTVRLKTIQARKKQKEAYAQLFLCAYAMLAGVTIDPRMRQAA